MIRGPSMQIRTAVILWDLLTLLTSSSTSLMSTTTRLASKAYRFRVILTYSPSLKFVWLFVSYFCALSALKIYSPRYLDLWSFNCKFSVCATVVFGWYNSTMIFEDGMTMTVRLPVMACFVPKVYEVRWPWPLTFWEHKITSYRTSVPNLNFQCHFVHESPTELQVYLDLLTLTFNLLL